MNHAFRRFLLAICWATLLPVTDWLQQRIKPAGDGECGIFCTVWFYDIEKQQNNVL